MSRRPAIVVIDIGKSNAKLALVDAASRAPVAVRTTANAVVTGAPYPHHDVERLWTWIVGGLAAFAREADVAAISVATHGACFALLSGDQLALPILDYEYAGPETVHAEYAGLRGDFSETLSPDLPNGLNAGRQIYWQSRKFPAEFARADVILPYPQYWVWRLTGEKVAEATSLGCHTDLWNPGTGGFSRLVHSQGWDRRFPRLVGPSDTVGTILPAIAGATGIAPRCRVVAGIHDSNASLLPHLLARPQPFAVLSTGTWLIAFAVGGDLARLDPHRDCLANVDAFGRAVPSSRFMAGREFEIIAGSAVESAEADIARVVSSGIMALPTFATGTGPFGTGKGRWTTDPSTLSPGERAAAASLYAALVTETCLALAGADGPVVVEGPFAKNRMFLAALAELVPRPLIARPGATGTIDGATLLAAGADRRPDLRDPPPVEALGFDLIAYAAAWRQRAAE